MVAAFAQIKAAWEAFQPYLDNDIPPQMTDQDTLTCSDDLWQQAAAEYLSCKVENDEAQAKADEAKAKLIALTSHSRESG